MMQTPMPVHPGSIKFVDVYSGSSEERPISKIPEHKQFAYFRKGLLVDRREDADEIVPIVEVRMFPLDDEGNLVPKSKAVEIRIQEHGPDGRVLRWTLMRKQ